MPGTITNGDPSIKHLGRTPSYSYDVTLTLDGSGNLSGVPLSVHPGYLMAVDTIPDAVAPPSDGYALQLLNEHGVDILSGGGTGRSATISQRLVGKPSPVQGNLYPTVASGGNAGVIHLMLWIQGA